MRAYILDNQNQFLGNLIVRFIENPVAIETQKSINKRIQEEDKFGGCMARGCQNLMWTVETDSEIKERLYKEFMKEPIIE